MPMCLHDLAGTGNIWWSLAGGAVGEHVARCGRAVQVDPVKPTLKAPKSKLLKLAHEKVLSDFL